MAILTTVTGANFDTDRPARSNLIMKFTGYKDTRIMQSLKVIGIDSHIEAMQPMGDVIVEDEFGETHTISEDFVWH